MRIVVEDTLSTRRIDVILASKQGSASAASASGAILVDVGAGGVIATAHGDVVDLINRVGVGVVGTADPNTEELIPESVTLPDEGPLHLVVPVGRVRDLVLVARAEHVVAVDGHARLVDVVPVRAPLQVPLVVARAVDDVGVDGVVGAAVARGHHDAVVRPRPGLHRRRRRVPDRRHVAPRRRHRVEAVVEPPDVADVGRPQHVVARVVDDAGALDHAAARRPRARQVVRRRDPDQAQRREPEVLAVGSALHHGRIMREALSRACAWGRVRLDGRGQESQQKC